MHSIVQVLCKQYEYVAYFKNLNSKTCDSLGKAGGNITSQFKAEDEKEGTFNKCPLFISKFMISLL